ncbi:intein-containing cell division cycle 14 isoform a precursor [Anaeramoeba ignava]|uniref:Intein-containing cell division cycle 14 isoform a n=1 Tax=Anaeramoeba ignava TaxID=1746090 RepID=A0A9Q0REL5_ANAIG|nr:intein-containing cell division cycle 14 isoform a precursor [Anaeramoeba ignava]
MLKRVHFFDFIKNRLYFFCSKIILDSSKSNDHYFTIENEFIYQPFANDFGPYNLAQITKFCEILFEKMNDPELTQKKIIFYCLDTPESFTNSAVLICSFMMIAMEKTPEEAFKPFEKIDKIISFRDASYLRQTFSLTVLDVLNGLYKAMKCGFYNFETFSIEEFVYHDKIENGDMNWIIPGKLLAFSSPRDFSNEYKPENEKITPSTDQKKKKKKKKESKKKFVQRNTLPSRFSRPLSPEKMMIAENLMKYYFWSLDKYVEHFQKIGITSIIRLNLPLYDSQIFIQNNISHHHLYYEDGGVPSWKIINHFLNIVEKEINIDDQSNLCDEENNSNLPKNNVIIDNDNKKKKDKNDIKNNNGNSTEKKGGVAVHCFAANTKILMSNFTTKKIQDIKQNEQVLGVDYLPKLVSHTIKGFGKLYKISRKNQKDYFVSKKHILCLLFNKKPHRFIDLEKKGKKMYFTFIYYDLHHNQQKRKIRIKKSTPFYPKYLIRACWANQTLFNSRNEYIGSDPQLKNFHIKKYELEKIKSIFCHSFLIMANYYRKGYAIEFGDSINITVENYMKKCEEWKKSHSGYKSVLVDNDLASEKGILKMNSKGNFVVHQLHKIQITDTKKKQFFYGFELDGNEKRFLLKDHTVVHNCKAGLGRTGTLNAIFLMKNYHFTAREAIGYMRLCRPGSIIGKQQFFLIGIEEKLHEMGKKKEKFIVRNPPKIPIEKLDVSFKKKDQLTNFSIPDPYLFNLDLKTNPHFWETFNKNKKQI